MHVFFTPGNHDVWLHRTDTCENSMVKLLTLLEMCEEEGIHTTPQVIGQREDGSGGVQVVPLLSWHHQSFDTEPDITCWDGIPKAEEVMSDYHRCKWPTPLDATDDSVAE